MSRFTLYCLDDGDEYFGHCIADYLPPRSYLCPSNAAAAPLTLNWPQQNAAQDDSNRQKIRGRLRLAGRGLYFEPDNVSLPILLFRYRLWDLDHVICGSTAPLDPSSGNSLAFRCIIAATQMENCVVGPHGELRFCEDDMHVFHFTFAREKRLSAAIQKFIDELCALLAAESTRTGEKVQVIGSLIEATSRETPFSLTFLQSPSEDVFLQSSCSRICPLTVDRGRLVLTSRCLYFHSIFPLNPPGVLAIPLKDARRVERRRTNFVHDGMEIALVDGSELLFAFQSPVEREKFFECLVEHPLLDRLKVNDLHTMMRRWESGAISNFDYLMFLNWAAGRSMNDLAQYPVMPWIISDYSSDTLDISNPNVYRDLSKPIGALNEGRLLALWEKVQHLKEIKEEPYLFGTHYSNPAYVAYFLVREFPEYVLVLQGGKLDHPSRIFESVGDCWNSVTTCATDLKELIPQFYFGDGKFLSRSLDLGLKPDGTNVRRDVILPPWCASPQEFVFKLRSALEGPIVSCQIHEWIDLIFGYKQQGKEAWKAHNVFHPYSYESCIQQLQKLPRNDVHRQAIETHIREFGQVPKQLFTAPHPRRHCRETPQEKLSLTSYLPPDSDDIQMQEAATVNEEATVPADCPLYSAAGHRTDAEEISHLLSRAEAIAETPPVQSLSPALEATSSPVAASLPQMQMMARTALKLSTKPIDASCLCHAGRSASWILDMKEDSHTVAFASEGDGNINVVDITAMRKLRVLPKIFGLASIRALSVTKSEDCMFIGSHNGSVYVMDVARCSCLHELEVSETGIAALCHAREFSQLICGGRDGTVRFWPLVEGNRLARTSLLDVNTDDRVVSLSLDPTETIVLIATASDGIVTVDLEVNEVVAEIDTAPFWGATGNRHDPVLFAALVAPQSVCIVKRCGILSVDLSNESEPFVSNHFTPPFPVGAAAVTSPSMLPARHLCVVSEDATSLCLLRIKSGAIVSEVKLPDRPGADTLRATCVALSAQHIVVGDSGGFLSVVEIRYSAVS